MYETMRYWETAHTLDGQSPVGLDFAAIWQAADKIVYSTTLQSADTAKTRVERDFDPAQVRLNLTLAQEHTFGSGTVYLCYHPA
jgi:uncharacterized protein YcbX